MKASPESLRVWIKVMNKDESFFWIL